MLLEQARQYHCLAYAGDGLAGKQVRARAGEHLEAWPVECREAAVVDRVAAPIFRPVRQHRTVRSDGGCNQRPEPLIPPRRLGPKLIPRGNRESDGVAHRSSRALVADAAGAETLESRLIG